MMPGGPDGLATLEHLKRVAPDLPVVMMSGKASLADAVRATKLGAFQFLEKPLTPEGLLTTLRAALELSRTLAENRRLHEALGHSSRDRKSTRLNSSHLVISYAVFCLKKKKIQSYSNETRQTSIPQRA